MVKLLQKQSKKRQDKKMQQKCILIDFCLRKTMGTIGKPDLLFYLVHAKDEHNKKDLSLSELHQPNYLTIPYLYDILSIPSKEALRNGNTEVGHQ